MIEKTLLTFTPREFLAQTNKMKHAVEKWAKLTDIKNIMKRRPKIEALTGSDADKDIKARNADSAQKQGLINLSDLCDAALDKHLDETLEVIALMFFMTPDELDHIESREMLSELNKMLNDEAIVGFFSSVYQTARVTIGA